MPTPLHRLLIIVLLLGIHLFPPGTAAFSMTNPPHPKSETTSTSSKPSSSAAATSSSTTLSEGDMRFGKFLIPKASIFCRSESSAAFVNLRPIVPGHVLIMPHRVTPLMEDLSETEYTDLWLLTRKVQAMLKQHYSATAFNVAVQDGRAAGQSVPHVHVHILPRTAAGEHFERNDDIYEALEEWAPRSDMVKETTSIEVPDDADRVDRTPQMMADEAALYRRLLGDGRS